MKIPDSSFVKATRRRLKGTNGSRRFSDGFVKTVVTLRPTGVAIC